ncbi:hypothetical protein [Planctobacterium marinum]|uniref:Uncharacterized protein n=1 Tax=Planctobacterium marinum TaxID=1631968 RepID=A0AA48HI17_9ALTE|nr:hypothetical protein MACH26_05870 [Planctobacterium marinum]
MKRLLLSLLFISSFCAKAQEEMPDHDITMFDLVATADTFAIANPVAIAHRRGYENQPVFIDNNSLYFTRMDDVNADVWLWQMGHEVAITKTLESEYSPTPIPLRKGALSTVRVEHDGTQRLWQINSDGSFELLFSDVKPVGYHVWQEDNVALFVLGQPHRLEVTSLGQATTKLVDDNIGRCLALIPGSSKISYTTEEEGYHQLRTWDFSDSSSAELMKLPEQSQDYAWLNTEQLITSDGEQLLWWDQQQKSWFPVTMPESIQLSGITRLAISPNKRKIAIVHHKNKALN